MMQPKKSRNLYFHSHPLHGTFSLIASLALAGLIAIVILLNAR